MSPVTAAQRTAMATETAKTFETAAVRRRFPLVKDSYNNEVRDHANPIDLAIEITISPRHAREHEVIVDRDEQVIESIARVARGTDITGLDQIIVGTVVWEVIGPPIDAKTHIRLRIKHIEG